MTLMARERGGGCSGGESTGLYAVPFSGSHLGGHGQHLKGTDDKAFTLSTRREDSCVAVRDRLRSGEMRARRLTPVECERVQGFPDGWTDVEGVPEGARYRLCGNAVMPPVVEFLGRMMA